MNAPSRPLVLRQLSGSETSRSSNHQRATILKRFYMPGVDGGIPESRKHLRAQSDKVARKNFAANIVAAHEPRVGSDGIKLGPSGRLPDRGGTRKDDG
jgi:hypothetical protein